MKAHIIGKKDLGLLETLQSAFETAHNPGKAFNLLRLTLCPCELLGRFSLGVRPDLLYIGWLRRTGCSIAARDIDGSNTQSVCQDVRGMTPMPIHTRSVGDQSEAEHEHV